MLFCTGHVGSWFVETAFLGFTCSQERILFHQYFGLAVGCTLLDHGSISADFCYLLSFSI